MKIQIDTKTDSKDEIRKAIKLLVGLVGAHEVYTNETEYTAPKQEEKITNIFDNPTPTVGNFMNMFDEPEQKTETPETTKIKETEYPEIQFY